MMVSVDDADASPEPELLASASRGDPAAFERLIAGYRGGLYRVSTNACLRMIARRPRRSFGLAGELVAGNESAPQR
jgi:hypothetical protein